MNDIYEDNKILRFVITYTYTLNLLLGSTGPTNSEIIPRTGSEHSISDVKPQTHTFTSTAGREIYPWSIYESFKTPMIFTMKSPHMTSEQSHRVGPRRNLRPENLEIEKTLNSPQKPIFSSWWFSKQDVIVLKQICDQQTSTKLVAKPKKTTMWSGSNSCYSTASFCCRIALKNHEFTE